MPRRRSVAQGLHAVPTTERQVSLGAPPPDADRDPLALGAVYETAHALETLAELRQRIAVTAVMFDGELPTVERSLARALTAPAQLSDGVEELEAVAAHIADTLGEASP